MFTLLLLTSGVLAGAAGASAWLLSESGKSVPGVPLTNAMGDRVAVVKERLALALSEGSTAGDETENRLRHQFEAFRRHPDRPGTS